MENYLGKKIRQLRRAKDMTQEQLADYLNISYQSVSKWETGTAAPDLTFIIPLARLFGISTDELLGFEQSNEDFLKKNYKDAYEATWKSGDLEKRLSICLDAVQQYPGDMEWMKRLGMAHSMHCYSYEDNERYRAERAEAIRCYEIVIANTTDAKLKENAICAIVQDLSYAGRKEEAKQYALLYPEEKRDEIEQFYLEGKEQEKHKQKLLQKKWGHLMAELNYHFDDEHLRIAAELTKLFFSDGNYLDEHATFYYYELSLCKKAIAVGETDNAIEHLKKARYHGAEYDKIVYDFPGEYHYTCPLFDMLSVDTRTFLHTNNCRYLEELAQKLNESEFDLLRDCDEFRELVNSLV